jgi:L-lysine 2,3-aminomutase
MPRVNVLQQSNADSSTGEHDVDGILLNQEVFHRGFEDFVDVVNELLLVGIGLKCCFFRH